MTEIFPMNLETYSTDQKSQSYEDHATKVCHEAGDGALLVFTQEPRLEETLVRLRAWFVLVLEAIDLQLQSGQSD